MQWKHKFFVDRWYLISLFLLIIIVFLIFLNFGWCLVLRSCAKLFLLCVDAHNKFYQNKIDFHVSFPILRIVFRFWEIFQNFVSWQNREYALCSGVLGTSTRHCVIPKHVCLEVFWENTLYRCTWTNEHLYMISSWVYIPLYVHAWILMLYTLVHTEYMHIHAFKNCLTKLDLITIFEMFGGVQIL